MKEFSTEAANQLFELLRTEGKFSEDRSGAIADGLAGIYESVKKLFDEQIPALVEQLKTQEVQGNASLDDIRETCWQIHNHLANSQLIPVERKGGPGY
jgi:hypothetical protein